MFYWIYDLPNGVIAIIFSVGCLVINSIAIIITRPYIRRWIGPYPGANDLVSYILAAYGVFYGLLVGLIAVATYQNYSNVDNSVSEEAASLATLYRDVSGYPEPIREKMKNQLRQYCHYVIDKAWPLQQQGVIPTDEVADITAFQQVLISYEPVSMGDELLHAETLREFSNFVLTRHTRLQSITTGLPAVLWYVVIVGAILNLALTWLFVVDKLSVHLVVAGIISLFIGLLVFLIAAMDNPFRGEFSISPQAFQLVLDNLMNQ